MTMEALLKVLKELKPHVDFEKEKALVTGGILDSFDIVVLVGMLNDSFGIRIRVNHLGIVTK